MKNNFNRHLKFEDLSLELKELLTTPAPGLSRYGKPVYRIRRDSELYPMIWEYLNSYEGMEFFTINTGRPKYLDLQRRISVDQPL